MSVTNIVLFMLAACLLAAAIERGGIDDAWSAIATGASALLDIGSTALDQLQAGLDASSH